MSCAGGNTIEGRHRDRHISGHIISSTGPIIERETSER